MSTCESGNNSQSYILSNMKKNVDSDLPQLVEYDDLYEEYDVYDRDSNSPLKQES